MTKRPALIQSIALLYTLLLLTETCTGLQHMWLKVHMLAAKKSINGLSSIQLGASSGKKTHGSLTARGLKSEIAGAFGLAGLGGAGGLGLGSPLGRFSSNT